MAYIHNTDIYHTRKYRYKIYFFTINKETHFFKEIKSNFSRSHTVISHLSHGLMPICVVIKHLHNSQCTCLAPYFLRNKAENVLREVTNNNCFG